MFLEWAAAIAIGLAVWAAMQYITAHGRAEGDRDQ